MHPYRAIKIRPRSSSRSLPDTATTLRLLSLLLLFEIPPLVHFSLLLFPIAPVLVGKALATSPSPNIPIATLSRADCLWR